MASAYQYAGLGQTREEGLAVAESVRRIRHLAYTAERLMFLQAGHIISTPQWDLKGLLARLQFENGQHADQLKARLPELRVSRSVAYESFETPLAVVFDEAMHAADTVELLAGLAGVLKPALIEAYRRYLTEANGLADYTTLRLMRPMLADEVESLRLLEAACQDHVTTGEQRARAETWANHLAGLLEAGGLIDGTGPVDRDRLKPDRAARPYVIARQLRRDLTFPRVWDILHVDKTQVHERLAQMIATRLGEVTIAEALGFVLCETPDQPWMFYTDISRHLWDEMRHALFGEAASEDRYEDRGRMFLRDWEAAYLFKMTPLELYGLLRTVEAGLMKYPPGKREEFEFCRDTACYPLMRTFQDFDWADELFHCQIAHRRLKQWFQGSQQELIALGEQGLKRRAEARTLHPPSPFGPVRPESEAIKP